ncbi:unnamed protein product [Protopolystoma xenopodis]|uniref:Uncharacterized protein n=1 Tax=Protopolystoma xenopodis TaxID=117903 RepID=A0A448WWR6_9PLAT|nr:unnamed protein product [Protopolystoma xenopodis]
MHCKKNSHLGSASKKNMHKSDMLITQNHISTFTAVDYCDEVLYAGVSVMSGNYWFGGLSIDDMSRKDCFSLKTHNPSSEIDLRKHGSHIFLSFADAASIASVAAIPSLAKSKQLAAIIGLDDGSIQLVISSDSKMVNISY